jgi:hypothetical protein
VETLKGPDDKKADHLFRAVHSPLDTGSAQASLTRIEMNALGRLMWLEN